MFRRYKERLRAFLWSRIYEYRCAADWGADQGHIIKMRVNRWTNAIKIVEEVTIRGTYRTA